MIELRHLRYFVAVAEELNFTRAAERVHIDQTPLSRAVRDLEDELGVKLFVRAPRRLALTPADARLLEEARKLFIRFERTKRAVRRTSALYQPPLRIGVADGLAQPKLSECLAGWQAMAPAVPLELSEMRAHELAAALCQEAGFTPDIRHEAGQFVNVLALGACGLGVAIVPASFSTLPAAGVVFRPLEASRDKSRLAILGRPGQQQDGWSQQVAQLAAAELESLAARLAGGPF